MIRMIRKDRKRGLQAAGPFRGWQQESSVKAFAVCADDFSVIGRGIL